MYELLEVPTLIAVLFSLVLPFILYFSTKMHTPVTPPDVFHIPHFFRSITPRCLQSPNSTLRTPRPFPSALHTHFPYNLFSDKARMQNYKKKMEMKAQGP